MERLYNILQKALEKLFSFYWRGKWTQTKHSLSLYNLVIQSMSFFQVGWGLASAKKSFCILQAKKPTLKHQFYERRRSRVPFWNASLLYDTVLRGHIWVFTIAKHVLSCRHGLNYSSETLLCDDSGGFDAGIKTWDKVAGKYQVNKRTTFRSIQSPKNDTKQWGWGMQWVSV